MINRILIRIKVIQLLYSYLLIEQHFSLESQPVPPTKEKRFAYALYLDMLVLMVKIANSLNIKSNYPLLNNRFIRAVMNDEVMKSLLLKYNNVEFPFASEVAPLVEKVKESAILKRYLKLKEYDSHTDVNLWKDIFDLCIMSDDSIWRLSESMENYSLGGIDKMKGLMESTFTNFRMSQMQVGDVLKSLRDSMDKAYELYFRLLMLPVELTSMRERELDDAMHKYIVTYEDRNPNLRFVENSLVRKLAENEDIAKFVDRRKISWFQEDRNMLESLLRNIKESEIYSDYMNFPATDDAMDAEFWRNVFKYIIFNNELFLETLEDKSIFWNDDLEIVGTFVLKTLRRLEFDNPGEDGGTPVVLNMFKDDEDAAFGSELFKYAITNREEYQRLIESVISRTSSWDLDRLAFMDMVIMITALAEIMNFPKIPTTVSINEYIEMAKAYSTNKSGQFVHGVLGAAIARLREEHKLMKE